ncbi:MAG: hypothetical protein ABEI86_01350, partial [Halobacteriaceae archaeon]
MRVDYFLSKMTLITGYWDPSIASTKTSTIRVGIYNPIISIVSGLNTMWTIKLVQPLILVLFPIGIYLVLSGKLDKDTSL